MLTRKFPGAKKPPAHRVDGVKAKIISAFQDSSMSIEPPGAIHFTDSNPLYPKPAFSSLDHVSLVLAAEFWAVRPGPVVSVAPSGLTGFQVSDPAWASADRYLVGCDFLDPTFSFSFAGLSVVGKFLQSY
jgi:hypothetical protein